MTLRAPRRVCLLLALAASGCVSTSDIESIQSQLADLQRQVLQVQTQGSSKEEIGALQATVSQQTQALLKSEADMQLDLQSVSGQIEQLQAKLEDTNYRLEQLSLQIAATNQALQSQPSQPGPTAAPDAPPPPVAAGDPQTLYQSAYGDYLRKNYDLAIAGFQAYLEAYPETELADNAAYWIGESLYGQGKFEAAIRQFDDLVARFPRSDKTASAGLKKAFAYLERGNRGQGIAELQRLLREFPQSDEASLARNRLRDLGVDAR